jgi:hypothetical protein
MKKTMKFLLAAFVMMATVSLTGCNKDDENSGETYPASTSYAVHYQGQALAPGQKVVYNITDADKETDEATVDFYIKNLTQESLQTRFKVELEDGPESMKDLPVCYGQCKPVTCPYTWNVFTLVPGLDQQALEIHCYPSMHDAGSQGTYKITVGKGGDMEDPQVFFLQFNL